MRTTPIHALQQECGEMPLNIRRHKLQLQYSIKLKVTDNNPAKAILEDSWQNHYGNYKIGTEPWFIQVNEYVNNHGNYIDGPKIPNDPPWRHPKVKFDTSLSKVINKSDNPIIIKHYALELIETYNNHTHIYTDGSKTDSGKVGSAFYVPQILQESYRITNNASVFAAELVAIEKALLWILNHGTISQVVIFTDSLSSVESIRSNSSTSRPNHLMTIRNILNTIELQNKSVTLAWVPSHVGVKGNEEADRLCKVATRKPQVDIIVSKELSDAYRY